MKLPTRKKIFDVVGESRTNPDGRERQDILCEVDPGDEVQLVREPDNPYDQNAVAVTVGGETVGYIAREAAVTLAPILDSGRQHSAIVHCIRGGVPGARHYGCQISIAWDGAEPHPYRLLDDVQERSRAGKISVRGRERTVDGRFVSSRTSDSGCSLVALVIASVPIFGALLFH